MIKNILALLGLITVCVSVANASGAHITLKSIVQRANGIYFGVDYGDGQQRILSAGQAKAEIERVCPRIKIQNGVFGEQ